MDTENWCMGRGLGEEHAFTLRPSEVKIGKMFAANVFSGYLCLAVDPNFLVKGPFDTPVVLLPGERGFVEHLAGNLHDLIHDWANREAGFHIPLIEPVSPDERIRMELEYLKTAAFINSERARVASFR